MHYLHTAVKKKYPLQIDKVRYVLDGAGYHSSISTREFLAKNGMQCILLGPYSYLISVQEYVWGHLKKV